MYGNNIYSPYGNMTNVPPVSQPYGYPNNTYFNQMQQNAQNQAQNYTNTNKIYVSGIEEVKQRYVPFNSDILFIDNDKPLIYQKIVDSKGQFEVKIFDITPHIDELDTKETSSINLSNYVLKSDFDALESEIKGLKDKITKISVQNQMESLKRGDNLNGSK